MTAFEMFSLFGRTIPYLVSYKGLVSINVKFRGTLFLSDRTKAQLIRLPRAEMDRYLRLAEQSVRDWWWEGMTRRSVELGLGCIYSDGRSGGWLVFEMKETELSSRFEDAEKEYECRHCHLPFAEHVETKCPFEATTFEVLDNYELILFDAFTTFAKEVKESLNTVGERFEDELLSLAYWEPSCADGTHAVSDFNYTT